MDPAVILDQLTNAEELPKAALRAASERRAEMVPLFLREIDRYLALAPDERAGPTPLFFIFHLLGNWRQKSAYRPLARFLRCPSHELDVILGDATTSTSHRVMAAVCDGDPEPLFEIILDPNADEFIRSRMCEVLAMLGLRAELDRADVARFLRDAFMEMQPQACCYVWHGWQAAIAMLGLNELTILVRRMFDRGFIDRTWLSFTHFEQDLQSATRHVGELAWSAGNEYALFGDTVAELSTWHAFNRRDRADRRNSDNDLKVSQLYTNPFRGVGRNDLCPCGSGKKYKRCCLRLQRDDLAGVL